VTAEIVAARLNLPVNLDPELQESAGLVANIRTPNALPLWVEPPSSDQGWRLTAARGCA
jgi:hypothetical protein